ncbi:MAG: caspase family protein [Magnetococcales bacterium]|nr:caspase family protein [Magnetococcales bacterium]
MRLFAKLFLLSIPLGLWFPAPWGELQAAPAHMRAMGASRVVNAVRMNTRQIFRPTFSIRSRYAAGMRDGRFSKDGLWFASASGNGGAQLWNKTTGQRELDLRGHQGAVTAVAFIPGGEASQYGKSDQPASREAAQRSGVLATGGEDGTVRLWSLVSGESLRTIRAHGAAVSGLAVTADGQWLITSSTDATIKRWQLPSGKLQQTIQSGQGAVHAAVLDPNGERLATGGDDGSVRLWEVASGSPLQNWPGSDGPVLSLAWRGDGEQLASGHQGGVLQLWSPSGQPQSLTDHDGAIYGLAFSPSGDQLASVGQDGRLHLWSTGSGSLQKRLEAGQQTLRSITFSPDGRQLLTSGDDQTLRFWQREQPAELARLVTLRDGWAVVTPDGRFDGTLDGDLEDRLDAIQWSGEGHHFALDGFLEKYYRPALLGRLLSARPEQQEAVAADPGTPHVTEGFYLPPRVTIHEPSVNPAQPVVPLQVEAEDQGGGISETRLYHNDKIVPLSQAQQQEGEGSGGGRVEKITYNVSLVNGENRFRVVSLSEDRIESEPRDLALTYAATQSTGKPRLHLLVVGVNNYANPALNLNFAVPDAKGMLAFLMRSNAALFKQVVTYELYDQKATKAAINAAIADLYTVPAQDVVVLYFAGHGKAIGDQWFFAPHELSALGGEAIQQDGIASEQLQEHMARIGAQKMAVLFDACESGAAMRAFAEFDNRRSMAILSRATGIHIATATTGTQSASELADLGHGVFTYALLEGMKGKADRKPKDKSVSITELLDFIQQYVPFLNQKHNTAAMTPVVNSRGSNFDVSKR